MTAYRRWVEDRAPRLAAALAYYSVFSLAPMLLLAAGLGSLFLSDPNVRERLITQFSGILGAHGSEILGGVMRGAKAPTSTNVFGAVVGFAGLIVASLGLLEQLKAALNAVWDVEAPRTDSVMKWLQRYLANVGLVIATGFLLLVSLVATAAMSALTDRAHDWLAGPDALWWTINLVAGFVMTVVVFMLIYRVIPDTHVGWGEALSGGIFTGILFTVGRLVLGWYLGRKAGDSITDAAGSVLALMLWVYYSAQLVLFGAEFTVVFADRRQSAKNAARPPAPAQPVRAGGPGGPLV
ncbi:MAG TPA: YihY/virulence factor BrkB family protein [Vicinamibacterales bacterium]|nr:YihY/virulence factor BrkB family protein [Vicinamibacterales bacterium]